MVFFDVVKVIQAQLSVGTEDETLRMFSDSMP